MAGKPNYTVAEARADAREWFKGTTVSHYSRGWRECCAILDERISELEQALRDIDDVEGDVREQAIGEQDGYLLAIANRLAAALRNAAN